MENLKEENKKNPLIPISSSKMLDNNTEYSSDEIHQRTLNILESFIKTSEEVRYKAKIEKRKA